MTIEDLNGLERAAFVDAIGWVYEHSPWVAERAWERVPFSNLESLHSATDAEVTRATRDEQLALLRAHPDLGTRMKLSDASESEQSGVGLDQLTPDEFAALNETNREYRAKFGFPFLFAVKGSTKHEILAALQTRVHSTADVEFVEALRQVSRIAGLRLRSYLEQEK